MQRELSPVTHVARGKNIPPFLILHVADHRETQPQSQRLVKALQEAGISARAYPAEGITGDRPTEEMFAFLSAVLTGAARGTSESPLGKPELIALRELPAGQNKSGQWLSSDGRSLYWADKQGAEHWIWRADRPGPGQPFGPAARLFTGHDMTLSADMTEIILVDHDPQPFESQKFALFSAKKSAASDRGFGPRRKSPEIAGLGFVAGLCLSADGLTLYAEQFGDRSLPTNVRFHRPNRSAPWGKPEAVPLSGLAKGGLRFPFLSPDGQYLFGNNDESPSGMVVLTSPDGGKTFGSPRHIEVPGNVVKGKFPRYSPTTNELIFSELTTAKTAELYLIRNFDPRSTTKPLSRDAPAERTAPKQRELVRLDELNTPGWDFCPWVSPDGLTIYWEAAEAGTSWIWTASREGPELPFGNKKRLLQGRHPAVTPDGLQIVLARPQTGGQKRQSLHMATRPTLGRSFGEPLEIPELRAGNEQEAPWLSPDGLVLCFQRADGAGGNEFWVTTRASLGESWAAPRRLGMALDRLPDRKITWPHLTADRLTLYCVHEGPVGRGRFMVWSRPSTTAPFADFRYLEVPNIADLYGRPVRYIEATNELFFSSPRPRAIDQPDWNLWMIKNFTPR